MAGAFLFRASNAARGMEKRHLVHPRPADGLKVVCLPISGRKMGKTLLFGASAAERCTKQRFFMHPRGKDGQNNVSPCIRAWRMGKTTFFHPSATERCAEKRFPMHPPKKDAWGKAWDAAFLRVMPGTTTFWATHFLR
jgi:hypothetical protein